MHLHDVTLFCIIENMTYSYTVCFIMPIWFDGYQQNWMLLLSFWFNFYAILSKEHNKYTINNTKVVLIINIRRIFVVISV